MKYNVKLVIVAIAAAGLLALGGCGGAVEAPTSFDTYNAKDGSFACEYPADWNADGGGKGHHWAKFDKGSAEIRVDVQVTGSIMGDIMGSGNPLGAAPGVGPVGPTGKEFKPVDGVHQMEKEAVAEEMGDYEEQAPQAVRPMLGAARKSEFTASGSFGSTIHGYRVTVLSKDKRIRVVCKCSEDDWETLKPAFDRVIDSLKKGQAKF